MFLEVWIVKSELRSVRYVDSLQNCYGGDCRDELDEDVGELNNRGQFADYEFGYNNTSNSWSATVWDINLPEPAVPEPTTVALLAAGTLLLGLRRKRLYRLKE